MSNNNLKDLVIIKDGQVVTNAYAYNSIIVTPDITKFTIKIEKCDPNVSYNISIITNQLAKGCELTYFDGYGLESTTIIKCGETTHMYVYNGGLILKTTTSEYSSNSGVVAGYNAGTDFAQVSAAYIAIGRSAGDVAETSTGTTPICLGNLAGYSGEIGDNALALGNKAMYAQPGNYDGIVINGSGSAVILPQDNSCCIKPVRSFTPTSSPKVLYYNPTTFEMTYGDPPAFLTNDANLEQKIKELEMLVDNLVSKLPENRIFLAN